MSEQSQMERLAAAFESETEWKAYEARVNRILIKRDKGSPLSKEENHILADYKVACSLQELPRHHDTQAPIPPVLYGYGEAMEAFGVTRETLYALRAHGSPAFTSSLILTASLARSIKENPNIPTVPLNQIHTGAKGKLTPALQDSIIKALRFAPFLSVVAKAHGITGQTLANWRKKGENGDRKYRKFFEESEAAIGTAQTAALQNIASNESWQAQAKILEWTDPDTFGRKQSLEMTGKDGGPIKTDTPPPMTIILQGIAQHSYDPSQPGAPAEPDSEEAENGESGQ